MANIREAILKAADWIETNPQIFDWHSLVVPDCGSPGCALGWIGHFSGHTQSKTATGRVGDIDCTKEIATVEQVARETLKIDGSLFYSRLDELSPLEWRHRAGNCANALRLYADKYHPAEPSLPSGAEVCREIISKPYKEAVNA